MPALDAGRRDVAALRLHFGEPVNLSEGRLPFAVAGQWVWDDYGRVEITPTDLDDLVQNFNTNVRGQRLPLINEEHDPTRATGWIKSLERVAPDRVEAVVEYNEVGEELVKTKQYLYTSPELRFDYLDAATGQRHRLVGVGLALTNKPRIKALGEITCAETPVGVRAYAFAEGETLDWHMADPDNDGDDDGPVPPCVYQPPYSPIGCCPGYTRRGDADGDGACIFAEKGCNGYRAVGSLTPTASTDMYSEGTNRMATENANPEAPAADATVATPPAADAPAVNMAEVERERAEARAQVERLEAQVRAMAEEARIEREGRRVDAVQARLDSLVREGRLTPAERSAYAESAERLLVFAEHEWLLDSLAAREPVIRMAEIGSGETPDTSANAIETRRRQRAIDIFDKAKAEGHPIGFAEAAKRAAREVQ